MRLLQAELFIHNTCKSIINNKLLKILMTRKQVFFEDDPSRSAAKFSGWQLIYKDGNFYSSAGLKSFLVI